MAPRDAFKCGAAAWARKNGARAFDANRSSHCCGAVSYTHLDVYKRQTLLVRQLQPTDSGLPLEIYCFTSGTRWAYYEAVQSDIFDHLLAILPEFGLSVFQSSSDAPLSVNLRDQRIAGQGGVT